MWDWIFIDRCGGEIFHLWKPDVSDRESLGFQATVEIASFSNISDWQIILEIIGTEVMSYPVVPAPKLFLGAALIDEANCCLHLEWTGLIYK